MHTGGVQLSFGCAKVKRLRREATCSARREEFSCGKRYGKPLHGK